MEGVDVQYNGQWLLAEGKWDVALVVLGPQNVQLHIGIP
jgi:hypothetical protein